MKFESKLRALAVVPVVLFHAKITGFDGGFVGVDIFFVTSGFLITGIISEELQQGNFRLSKFYERRVRRILPTLFFMMIICGPFAYLWMLPDELENFGQSFVATAFSANNILLTLTSNYWDLASEFKPLIHTWSLAVEEQYYFAFHLIMMGIWKRGRSSVLYILTTIFGISLSFAIVVHMFSLNQLASSAVFYLPPTRIWELLLGAMAAMVFSSGRLKPSRGFVEILGILGLVLISVSVILFDKSLPSPSAYTLVPTIGATLIILFADVRSAAGRLLSWGPLVWIGLISYSLYLWHQPLFAFLRIYSREEPGTWQMAGAILVTVCLSALSWRYVEQPFRKSGVVSRGAVLGSSLLIGLALVLVGFTLHRSQGFPSRLYAADVIQSNALNIYYI